MYFTGHGLPGYIREHLAKAIASNTLQLHYQPQFTVANQAILGVEALLRWPSPTQGWLNPEQVVAVAEAHNLIQPLTEWVLRTAFAEFRMVQQQVQRLAINISASYLQQQNVAAVVQTLLAEFAIAPQQVELEITESVVLHASAQVVQQLRAIRHLGVALSIDDFGTGFCGLRYLLEFPVSGLKIDRAFLHQALANPRSATLYHDILQLARNLNLVIVAEGVESLAQLQFLQLTYCQVAQGYYLAKPMTLKQLQQFVQNSAPSKLLAVAEPALSLLP